MKPTPEVIQALAQLQNTPAMEVVARWLESERAKVIEALLVSQNAIDVHQSQGFARALGEFTRSYRGAQEALARSQAGVQP